MDCEAIILLTTCKKLAFFLHYLYFCSMKLFVHILIIYLSGLAFLPCTDGQADACCTNEEHLYEQKDSTESHTHQDHCPTLCSCSCCGTSVVLEARKMALVTQQMAEPSTAISFFYRLSLGTTFHSDVWQPPRMLS